MAVYAYDTASRFACDAHDSPAGRRQVVVDFASANGFTVDDWFVDEIHGCNDKSRNHGKRPFFERPEAMRLAAKLQSGDVVVVVDFWSTGETMKGLFRLLCELDERGVRLHFIHVGESSIAWESGGLVHSLLQNALEFGLDAYAEDASEGMARSKWRGGPRGGMPAPGCKHVGKKKGRRVVQDENQREAIRLIAELKEQGLTSYAIAKRLNESRLFWRKPKPNGARGFTLEHWDVRRVDRAIAGLPELMEYEQRSAARNSPSDAATT
jgi:DNA invertase Pin-like site-specific DNA recombinase